MDMHKFFPENKRFILFTVLKPYKTMHDARTSAPSSGKMEVKKDEKDVLHRRSGRIREFMRHDDRLSAKMRERDREERPAAGRLSEKMPHKNRTGRYFTPAYTVVNSAGKEKAGGNFSF